MLNRIENRAETALKPRLNFYEPLRDRFETARNAVENVIETASKRFENRFKIVEPHQHRVETCSQPPRNRLETGLTRFRTASK